MKYFVIYLVLPLTLVFSWPLHSHNSSQAKSKHSLNASSDKGQVSIQNRNENSKAQLKVLSKNPSDVQVASKTRNSSVSTFKSLVFTQKNSPSTSKILSTSSAQKSTTNIKSADSKTTTSNSPKKNSFTTAILNESSTKKNTFTHANASRVATTITSKNSSTLTIISSTNNTTFKTSTAQVTTISTSKTSSTSPLTTITTTLMGPIVTKTFAIPMITTVTKYTVLKAADNASLSIANLDDKMDPDFTYNNNFFMTTTPVSSFEDPEFGFFRKTPLMTDFVFLLADKYRDEDAMEGHAFEDLPAQVAEGEEEPPFSKPSNKYLSCFDSYSIRR